MKTQFAVWTVFELKTGEVAVSGGVLNGRLKMGQEGVAETKDGVIRVLIVGIGNPPDPNPGPENRQGLLLKILDGRAEFLNDASLDFG